VAVTFDAAVKVDDFTVATLTTAAFTIGAGSDRAAIVGLCHFGAVTNISCSVGGVAGTLIANTTRNNGSVFLTLWAVIAPSSGSQTATASWTTAVSASLSVITATGVHQTTPTRNGISASGSSPQSVNVTSPNGDLSVSMSGNDLAVTTQTTNQTQKTTTFGCMDVGPGTGNTTHTWTQAGSAEVVSGVSLRDVNATGDGIVFVTSGGATIGTAASTWSFVPGGSSMTAGSAIIVGVGVGSSVVTVSTMTDNTTNLYKKAVARGSPLPAAGAELWYAFGYSTASTRVSVTLSGSASGGIAYAGFTGVSTANGLGPVGSSANSTNSTAHSITEITSTSTGALIISFNRTNVSTISPIRVNANYTMWISTNTVVRCFGEYQIQTAASTATSPWTNGAAGGSSGTCLFSGVQAAFYDTVVIAAGGGDYYSPGGFALLGLQR
jgi:hypothetical protein